MAPGRVSTTNMAQRVVQNVEAIAQLHTAAGVSMSQRFIDRLTASIGRPSSIVVVLILVALWTGLNTLGAKAGLPRLDPPPFPWMQGALSLSALLVTIIVLATQRHQAQRAARRGDLELQVNLLAEQKTAKLVALLEELRRDLPSVRDRVDPVAAAMSKAVDPKAVLSVLEADVPPEGAPPRKD
jgi:uncharacterized membrane protein